MVITVYSRTDDGTVRNKRYVVIHVDDDVVSCIINTEPAGILKRNPAAMRCQVVITASDHKFMDYDSYVDCSKVLRLDRELVNDQLFHESWRLLGTISGGLRDTMIPAITVSSQVAPRIKDECCASLRACGLK